MTGTKAFAAFWLSVFFSLILDSYFDRYGPKVIAQIRDLLVGGSSAGAATVDAKNDSPPPAQPAPQQRRYDPALRQRLQALDRPQDEVPPVVQGATARGTAR